MSWILNKITGKEDTQPREPQPEQEESAVGSILRQLLSAASLGSDVLSSGISLPSSLYEPLSILQRQAELMEYSHVLDEMVMVENSLDKLAYVAAFAVSAYSATERYYTNFNPILGETFEYYDEEKGIKYLAEQVSHHPPISAIHTEGSGWVFWQNSAAETSFGGNSIDLNTHGRSHIYIPETKDHFFYTNPKSKIHNIIIGNMWLEHYGDLNITNMKTGETCVVTFKKSGFFGSVNYKIEGYVQDAKGIDRIKITGNWNSHVVATWLDTNESRELWRCEEDNVAHQKYLYTNFSSKLISTEGVLLNLLPPTDSRLRLDRITLERGEYSLATRLKKLMEERQRGDRKERAQTEEEWKPTFFHCIPEENGGEIWVYCGDYWEQREEKRALLAENENTEHLLNGGNACNTAADFKSYEEFELSINTVS
eukprot:TRINITY_DN46_c0_g1_i1.p1 TRINITY_DN46_c0_g1~~TRINITY_DN46_c0_g1_i1.p1  ORF type:complete len:426 (-),score=91.73 TRINITY_DN46_c0_g1_i1:122-1399(-)